MPAPRTLVICAALAVAAFGTVSAAPTSAAPAKGAAVAAAKPSGPKSSSPKCGGERPQRPGGGRYECTFEDDFSGGSLDTSKWLVQDTALSGVTNGRDCYVNDPKNVSVGGGVVRLTSRIEPAPFTCHSPYGSFTSRTTAATIASYDRFTQTYGRFEFQARMPETTVQGVHSALWLYPQEHTYGRWPHSGEIDVAEWFSGDPGKVYPSVHYQGEDPWKSTGYTCAVPTASSQFHRYAVEWTPTEMRFLYDGNLCFEHSWTPDAPLTGAQPFDHPFYLVLTQVFGGDWNNMVPETAPSATMLVDWVRVWR